MIPNTTQETSYGICFFNSLPYIFDTHRKGTRYVATIELLTEVVRPVRVARDSVDHFRRDARAVGLLPIPYTGCFFKGNLHVYAFSGPVRGFDLAAIGNTAGQSERSLFKRMDREPSQAALFMRAGVTPGAWPRNRPNVRSSSTSRRTRSGSKSRSASGPSPEVMWRNGWRASCGYTRPSFSGIPTNCIPTSLWSFRRSEVQASMTCSRFAGRPARTSPTSGRSPPHGRSYRRKSKRRSKRSRPLDAAFRERERRRADSNRRPPD